MSCYIDLASLFANAGEAWGYLGHSPVSKRNKSTDLGDFGAKPANLHTGSVFCAEED